jgi:hypothetical protein
MIKPTAGMRRHNDQASLDIRCFMQDCSRRLPMRKARVKRQRNRKTAVWIASRYDPLSDWSFC